jgi:hypothetical protein
MMEVYNKNLDEKETILKRIAELEQSLGLLEGGEENDSRVLIKRTLSSRDVLISKPLTLRNNLTNNDSHIIKPVQRHTGILPIFEPLTLGLVNMSAYSRAFNAKVHSPTA